VQEHAVPVPRERFLRLVIKRRVRVACQDKDCHMVHFLDRAGDRHRREICYRSSLTFDFDLLYGATLVGRFDELGAYECNWEAK